jgi:DNA-directed RNA polymerase subunit beta
MKQVKFGKIPQAMEMPDLLEMQTNSFRDFMQLGIEPEERKLVGLQAAFLDVFPIESADGSMVLDFVRYEFSAPRYATPEEAQDHDSSWSRPLKAILRLSSRQPSGKLKQIVEQEVVLCEIPIMTDTASFIINGAERVVVSQLHRSPGIIFEEDEEKKISALGKKLFLAKVIPYRGAWIEFEFDLNNVLFVRIDRKKKFEATSFLRACGIESDADILKIFYPYETIEVCSTASPARTSSTRARARSCSRPARKSRMKPSSACWTRRSPPSRCSPATPRRTTPPSSRRCARTRSSP